MVAKRRIERMECHKDSEKGWNASWSCPGRTELGTSSCSLSLSVEGCPRGLDAHHFQLHSFCMGSKTAPWAGSWCTKPAMSTPGRELLAMAGMKAKAVQRDRTWVPKALTCCMTHVTECFISPSIGEHEQDRPGRCRRRGRGSMCPGAEVELGDD
jgi:hypothetical protein